MIIINKQKIRRVGKRCDSEGHQNFTFINHCCHRRLKGYPLQVRHKRDWGRGFILLLPQAAVLPESNAGSDVVKLISGFAIQNRQTSGSMWSPMYGAHY